MRKIAKIIMLGLILMLFTASYCVADNNPDEEKYFILTVWNNEQAAAIYVQHDKKGVGDALIRQLALVAEKNNYHFYGAESETILNNYSEKDEITIAIGVQFDSVDTFVFVIGPGRYNNGEWKTEGCGRFKSAIIAINDMGNQEKVEKLFKEIISLQ